MNGTIDTNKAPRMRKLIVGFYFSKTSLVLRCVLDFLSVFWAWNCG